MLPAVRAQIAQRTFHFTSFFDRSVLSRNLPCRPHPNPKCVYSIKWCYIHIWNEWSVSRLKNWTVTEAQRHYKDIRSDANYKHPLSSNCRNTMKFSSDESWLASEAASARGKYVEGGMVRPRVVSNSAQNGCVHLQNVETHPCVCHPGIDAAFTVQEGWGGGNGGQKLLPHTSTREGRKMVSTPWWEVIKRRKKYRGNNVPQELHSNISAKKNSLQRMC